MFALSRADGEEIREQACGRRIHVRRREHPAAEALLAFDRRCRDAGHTRGLWTTAAEKPASSKFRGEDGKVW